MKSVSPLRSLFHKTCCWHWGILLCLAGSVTLGASAAVFNVRQFGAIGDGTNVDTVALQQAIDAAAASGGGQVTLPPGRYLSGSLDLKSHVTLQVDAGATLLGSPHQADYHKANFHGLLLADHQTDITLCGQGEMDGQGTLLAADTKRRFAAGEIPAATESWRPVLINFRNCTNVTVRDITLRNSSCWVEDYRDCDRLTIENITVHSIAAMNNDGIDLDGCVHAVVRGCDINSEDDGICLKSVDRACDDILVEHCRVRSSCNALKFGTGSWVGFKHITCRDLDIYDTYISGIALEIVDGGEMDHVQVSHIRITDTHNPIFIRLGHRDTNGPVGTLHDVTLSDITATIPNLSPASMTNFPGPNPYNPQALITASITGLPGHPVEGVTLKNITLLYGGIGAAPQPKQLSWHKLAKVPECARNYPECRMFGILPAWGIYCRHARGITFDQVTLRLQDQDCRPAMVCDDVQNLRLNGLHVESTTAEPVLVFNNVDGADFHDSPAPASATAFLKTLGKTQNLRQP